MDGIKYDPTTTKPIININAQSNETPPGSNLYNAGALKIPQNGPFPISYFAAREDPQIDKKLMSFLKNSNNI